MGLRSQGNQHLGFGQFQLRQLGDEDVPDFFSRKRRELGRIDDRGSARPATHHIAALMHEPGTQFGHLIGCTACIQRHRQGYWRKAVSGLSNTAHVDTMRIRREALLVCMPVGYRRPTLRPESWDAVSAWRSLCVPTLQQSHLRQPQRATV